MRIETGALQINDDWTGLFIRGDDALNLGLLFREIYHTAELDNDDEDVLLEYISMIDFDVDHKSSERELQRIRCEDCE